VARAQETGDEDGANVQRMAGWLAVRHDKGPRGRGAVLDFSLCVYPSGATMLAYQHPKTHARAEQVLNDYTEAERAFRALWEQGRRSIEEQPPQA
jgi:hypothetical protein